MDIEKMKRELAAIREGNGGSSSNDDGINYFKMEPGNRYQVRVLEAEAGPVIKEWHWHFGVAGRNHIICNKRNFNDECPVCELASAMWREYDDGGRTDESLGNAAKKLFAKNRFYANVLERGDEDAGPKVYSFGKRVAESMYESFLDPDYDAKFLDPESGYDFKIKYDREDPNDMRTSKTIVKASPKPSPLAESVDEGQSIVEAAHNLDELFTPAKVEDTLAILDKYEAPIDTEDLGSAKYGDDDKEGSSDVMSAINRLENTN